MAGTTLDLTLGCGGGKPADNAQVFATFADLAAAKLDKGKKAIVSSDPDPDKNGRYTALIDGATLPKDFLKEPGPFEIFPWKKKTKYKARKLLEDQNQLYYTTKDFRSGNLIADDIAAGNIVAVGSDGLRGSPVADVTLLAALPAKDFELRQVLAGPVAGSVDKEYVFKMGVAAGDIRDDAHTGYWIEAKANVSVTERYSEVVTVPGKKSFDTTFELETPMVFRDGLVAEVGTWTIKPTKLGIDTAGEKRNATIDIITLASFDQTEKYNNTTATASTTKFDVGSNMEETSIIVFKNGILLQPSAYVFDVAKPSLVSFTSGLPRKTTITIVYKRMK